MLQGGEYSIWDSMPHSDYADSHAHRSNQPEQFKDFDLHGCHTLGICQVY